MPIPHSGLEGEAGSTVIAKARVVGVLYSACLETLLHSHLEDFHLGSHSLLVMGYALCFPPCFRGFRAHFRVQSNEVISRIQNIFPIFCIKPLKILGNCYFAITFSTFMANFYSFYRLFSFFLT